MDISTKFLLCTDEMIQNFLRNVDTDELAVFMGYHLSDDANKCILRNMSIRASDLTSKDIHKFKDVMNRYDNTLDGIIKNYNQSTNENCIMFTDLVNSTEKINLLGDTDYYENVLIKHNNILLESINKNSGRVIKNIGDAYLATFFGKLQALKCCIEAQEQFENINSTRDPELHINVRMALHYGKFDLKLMENNNIDVYGSSINYAARMVSYTGGGQIFVSNSFRKDWNKLLDHFNNDLIRWENDKNKFDEKDVNKWIDLINSSKALYNRISFTSTGFYSFKGFENDQELYLVNI